MIQGAQKIFLTVFLGDTTKKKKSEIKMALQNEDTLRLDSMNSQ